MNENEISRIIVEAAIEAHRALGGPGPLETVYEEALAFELESRRLTVHRQKVVPLVYKGGEHVVRRAPELGGALLLLDISADVGQGRIYSCRA